MSKEQYLVWQIPEMLAVSVGPDETKTVPLKVDEDMRWTCDVYDQGKSTFIRREQGATPFNALSKAIGQPVEGSKTAQDQLTSDTIAKLVALYNAVSDLQDANGELVGINEGPEKIVIQHTFKEAAEIMEKWK